MLCYVPLFSGDYLEKGININICLFFYSSNCQLVHKYHFPALIPWSNFTIRLPVRRQILLLDVEEYMRMHMIIILTRFQITGDDL